MSDLPAVIVDAIEHGTCLSVVLSKKQKRSETRLEKLTVRPVAVQGQRKYQLTSRWDHNETHENLTADATIDRLAELFGTTFQHCHVFTTEADYAVRISRKGAIKINKGRPSRQVPATDHNRGKHYLIPENEPCPFLIEIGVMTPAGKVRSHKYQKFRQINRFLELVDDILPYLPREGPLHIVDFGCGKSYLTFALHHLLTVIRGRTVQIVGLDRNADVIENCSRVARHLGCQGLQFRVGDIAGHEARAQVDLAVSLHACDTATDDALAKAIGWQARVILAVPCCQHELAAKMRHESPLQQYGILKERFAALATDALRAQALEISGYKTQVAEFIDLQHTAKNILIRASRRDDSASAADSHPNIRETIESYRRFKQSLGIDRLYLEDALGEDFLRRVSE